MQNEITALALRVALLAEVSRRSYCTHAILAPGLTWVTLGTGVDMGSRVNRSTQDALCFMPVLDKVGMPSLGSACTPFFRSLASETTHVRKESQITRFSFTNATDYSLPTPVPLFVGPLPCFWPVSG